MDAVIYIRTLKRAEHTVFCVADGQKYYFDSQFNRRIPFSSGQQVKRSIIDTVTNTLNVVPSPTTFLWDKTKQGELKEGEVYGTCDPVYVDQLFGGWMKAAKGGKDKTLKRRSPLSISAMRGLHPLLAGIDSDAATYDRSERSNNIVIVRDENGNQLSEEEIVILLQGKDRSLNRKWIPDQKFASGLFVSDIAIDLRRLFCVSLNPFEPEISEETIAKLKTGGWIESETVFGKCLVVPGALREIWARGLAHGIINWKISSNQSRTFSLMETFAIAISGNANLIGSSIRAKLSEENSGKAKPVIDESIEGVELYITPQTGGYIPTTKEDTEALSKAEEALVEKILAFDFENQLK